MRKTWMTAFRLGVAGATLATVGFAQMGGGMMGSGSTGSGMSGGGMMGGIGRMPNSMFGMNGPLGSMATGVVVGADGTAYVLRQATVTSGTQQTTQNQLVAVNPSTGQSSWSLPIDGTMISQPVMAKDGTILLTTSVPNRSTNTAKPALVIVTPGASSASIKARTEIDADILSEPVVTPDGQAIYVIAVDMPGMSSSTQTVSTGSTYLYAFYSGTGIQKFKFQLR